METKIRTLNKWDDDYFLKIVYYFFNISIGGTNMS